MHEAELSPAIISRRRTHQVRLTKVDRRSAIGKRIEELRLIYATALSAAGELTPIQRLQIDTAAELMALAEQARGEYLRQGPVSLEDLVRIERKASHAFAVLGLDDRPGAKRPSRFGVKHAERSTATMAQSLDEILAEHGRGGAP